MAEKNEAVPEKADLAPGFESLQGVYERFARPVLYALVAVLVILTLGTHIRNRRAASLSEASEVYWSARSPQELLALPEDYPQSPLAPLARLRAAKEFFDGGQYGQALNLYREFQTEYPDHFMLSTARMGEWQSQEALGQTAQALDHYTRFAETQLDHFLAPQAVLGQARCLEALGRAKEAREVITRFLASDRHPDWHDLIQEQLDRMDRRRRREEVSVTIPVPPASEGPTPETSSEVPLITIPDPTPVPAER